MFVLFFFFVSVCLSVPSTSVGVSLCLFSFFFLFWVKATYEKNDGFFSHSTIPFPSFSVSFSDLVTSVNFSLCRLSFALPLPHSMLLNCFVNEWDKQDGTLDTTGFRLFYFCFVSIQPLFRGLEALYSLSVSREWVLRSWSIARPLPRSARWFGWNLRPAWLTDRFEWGVGFGWSWREAHQVGHMCFMHANLHSIAMAMVKQRRRYCLRPSRDCDFDDFTGGWTTGVRMRILIDA